MTTLPSTGRLLAWILLKPSAWRELIGAIAPDVKPEFALLALPVARWRERALQQLVYRLLLWPLFGSGLLISGLVWQGGWLHPFALWGWALGACITLVFAYTVSLAAGAVLLLFAPILIGWIVGQPNGVMLDLLLGTEIPLAVALFSATVHYVIGNLSPRQLTYRLFQRLGTFMLGILVTLLVALGLLGLLVYLIDARQASQLVVSTPALYFSGVGFVGFGLIAIWRAKQWWHALLFSTIIALVLYGAFGAFGVAFSDNPGGYRLVVVDLLNISVIYLLLFLLPFTLAERIAGLWAGTLAGTIGTLAIHPILGVMIGFYALPQQLWIGVAATAIGLTASLWLPYFFYPWEAAWNTLLQRLLEEYPRLGKELWTWHTAFWDETQHLPLWGLDQFLLTVSGQPFVVRADLFAALAQGPQRWAVAEAQIELDVRQLEACRDLTEIAAVAEKLLALDWVGSMSPLLRHFSVIGNDVAVTLEQVSFYNRRLLLLVVQQDLAKFALELTRSVDPHAQRLQPAAAHWQQIVTTAIADLANTAQFQHELPNPYVVGVPLTRHQEIFVGRRDVSVRIEQFLRGPDQPPLLLYGQRRMGKTSLLYNLRWMLPTRIVPLVVDLEGPVSLGKDHASFLYNLSRGMIASARQQSIALNSLPQQELVSDPFTRFDVWLDEVEGTILGQNRTTILLALDEFEALERALHAKLLGEEAILGTLRHMIQHRSRFKLLFAGSHTFGEFQRWSSYLINAQTIHLTYLQRDEACQLIERPLVDFPLSYTADALDALLTLTNRHPYLVQLLCSELIMMKNEQPYAQRNQATVADISAVIAYALERGSQFFADIELHQIDPSGRTLLHRLAEYPAHQGCTLDEVATLYPDTMHLQQALGNLAQRELITQKARTVYCQIPLLLHWFRKTPIA